MSRELLPLPLPLRRQGREQSKRPGFPGRFESPITSHGPQAANSAFIFFSAFASTWRMRSAETPYSSASSCKVTLLSSSSQRRLTMSRERSSRQNGSEEGGGRE